MFSEGTVSSGENSSCTKIEISMHIDFSGECVNEF